MAHYSSDYKLRDENGKLVIGGFKGARAVETEGAAIKIHFEDGGILVIPVQNIVGELFIELVK